MKKHIKLVFLMFFILIFASCSKLNNVAEISEKDKILNAEEAKKREFARKAFTYRKDKNLDTLTFGLLGEDGNYNPFYFQTESDEKVVSFLFRKLFYIEMDGLDRKIIPVLAEKVEISDDLRTYSIKLNKNAKWQDGKPIKARDLSYTLETILNSDKANLCMDFKKYGKFDFEIVDDYNFIINLKEPSYSFLFDLEKIYMVPKHIFKLEKDKKYNFDNINELVGSSPYKVKKAYLHEKYHTKTIELSYIGQEKTDIKTIILRYSLNKLTNRFDLEDYNMNFGIVDQNGGRHFIANEIYNVKIFREGYDAYFLFKLKSKNNQDPVFRKGVGEYIYSVLVPNHYGLTDFVKKSDSVFSPTTMYYRPTIQFNKTIFDKEIEYIRKK